MNKYYLFVSYSSYKGGTNNVQVATIRPTGATGMFLKRFTSEHEQAEKRARRWAKKNKIELI
jgi:hypothetical protein